MFRKVNVPSSVLQKRRDKLSESSSSTSESHSALSQNNSEASQENLSSKDDLSFATSSSASSHSSSSSSLKSSVSSSSYIRHSHKSNASNDAKSERTSKEKKLYEEVLQTKETKIILDKSAEADENKQKNAVEEEEDEEVLNRVKDFKLLQKTRKRNKGLNAQKLFSMEEKVEEEEEDETAGYGLLDRQFTSKGDPTTIEVDTHLEEFLKAHLEKNAEKEEEKTPKIDDKTAELYKIPEHLQVKDTISEHADRMNWVTGLMEVPLPLEVKLKNIEATEKAKRALLKLGKKDHNYTEDPDYIVHKAFGSRFQNYDRFPKSKLSTDKATLDRFRKRFRR